MQFSAVVLFLNLDKIKEVCFNNIVKTKLAMVMAASVLLVMMLAVMPAMRFNVPENSSEILAPSLGAMGEYEVVLATALAQTDAEEAEEGLFRYEQKIRHEDVLYLLYADKDRSTAFVRLVNLTAVDVSGFDSLKLSSADMRWVEEQTQEHFAMG
jgi:hypothetical protein